MTIYDLIEEAKVRCPEFKRKITHRLEKRKKAPEFDWLFSELKRVLGESFLREAAKQELERVDAGKDDTDSHNLHLQAAVQVAKQELDRVKAGSNDSDNHELHIQAHIQAIKDLGLH